jgi:ABC-type branched-subunit amino acid transport system substrate-binding protein
MDDENNDRGRAIYRSGRSLRGGPITASLQGSGSWVSASLLSCSGCHGDDGIGRREGGINPPDLTWQVLSGPSSGDDRPGARRPAYDDVLINRAITMGVDSAGRPLGPGMPRYRLSSEDMADLIDYLKVLGQDAAPGVTGDEIRLGCLLPPEAAAAGLGQAVRQTLEASLGQLNRRGGVFGRRLTLHVQELPDSPDRVEAIVDAFLDRVRPFALVCSYLDGLEGPIGRAIARHEPPLVGALAPFPASLGAADRWTFHLHSSLASHGAALARFAAMRLPGVRESDVVVLHADDIPHRDAADAVERAWAEEGGRTLTRIAVGESTDAAQLVGRLKEDHCTTIFFLGVPASLGNIVAELGRTDWFPYLLAPGGLSGPDLFNAPPGLDRRIFLGFPQLASDVTATGSEEIRRMEGDGGTGLDHQAVRLTALASLRVLTEGLNRCGRDVDRPRLVRTLETLRGFETDFMRPLTFSPNEHTGLKGAYVLLVDLKQRRLRPIGDWIPSGRDR